MPSSDFMVLLIWPMVLFVLCGLAGYALFQWPAYRLRRTLKFVGYRHESMGQVVMSFVTADGFMRDFRGRCTVWREEHNGRPCDLWTEKFLYDTWTSHVVSPNG